MPKPKSTRAKKNGKPAAMTSEDAAILFDLWTISHRLAGTAKRAVNPVWGKATAKAEHTIKELLGDLERAATQVHATEKLPHPLVLATAPPLMTGWREGKINDYETLYETLLGRMRVSMAEQTVLQLVDVLLIMLVNETAGMIVDTKPGMGGPDIEGEWFALAADKAIERVGKGKKYESRDAEAIVKAVIWAATGYERELGVRAKMAARRVSRKS